MKKSLFFLLCCLHQQLFTQPVINTFSPASGLAGTTVVISGTGFGNNSTSNIVFFGAVRATVISSSSTSVSVTVPAAASYQPITITVAGLTGFSRKPFAVTFPGGGAITSSSFATRQDLNISPASMAALAGKDLDNDGKPDIVSSSITPTGGNPIYGFSVFKNNSTPGTISLSSAIHIPAPFLSYYTAVADMDGDGKLDIVAPLLLDPPNTAVRIFKNSSAGGNISFASGVSFSSNGGYGVAVADFDGDGMPDFSTTNNANSGHVSVHRNISFGGFLSFAPYQDFATGSVPRAMAAGYINDDNKPDLVIANQKSGTFSLLINTSTAGNISFAQPVNFATTTGSYCEGIAIADFDGDDKADVVVTNNNIGVIGTISIFRNLSSGAIINFAPKADLTTATNWNPFAVAVSDIDGNGKPEIIVGNQEANAISVFRNKSTPGVLSFEPKTDFSPHTPVIWAFLVGDIDGDSKPDIFSGSGANPIISSFRNTIEAPTIVSFSPLAACADSIITITGTNFTGATAVRFGGIAAASFSVISATTIKAIPGAVGTGIISVTTPSGTGSKSGFTNTGSCALPPQVTIFSPTSGPIGTSVIIKGKNFNAILSKNIVYFGAVKANVTASTDTSLIVTVPVGATNKPLTVTSNNLTAYALKPFSISFDGGTGSCDSFIANTFLTKLDFATGASPYANMIVDMDGDNKPDIATANFSANNISLLKNESTTTKAAFTPPVSSTAGTQPVGIAYGDVDGDGKQDLAVVNYLSNTTSVFRNISSGNAIAYAPATTFNTGANPRGIYIRDMDLDGKPDLIVSNFTGNTVSLLRNTSSGTGVITFAGQLTFATGNGPSGIFVLDIDNDLRPDIAVTNTQSNTLSVLKNISTGLGNIAFSPKTDFPTGNQPLSLFADDLDNDGKSDIIVTNYSSSTISLFKNTSAPGTISFVARLDYVTGLGPVSVAVADINGDNKPDIATSNVFDGNISVFKNVGATGLISFDVKSDYATGGSPRSISIGDFNEDNKPDIVATNYDDNTISVLSNNLGLSAGQICAGGNAVFLSEITGSNFQWQQDSGGGFVNILDNINFSGTHTNTLLLNALPSSWYGYQYRCLIDGIYSNVINLTFINKFTGAVDTSWENPGNWSCNMLPDINTDVTISCAKNVVLSSNGVCRRLTSKQGASVLVKTGVTLTISH